MIDKSPEAEVRLVVRHLTVDDLEAIQRLQKECFPDLVPWSRENLENHLELFPEGQIGIELDGTLVASSSSLILDSSEWKDKHTFEDICPKGFLSNHEPEGNLLYGLDIVVSPSARGMRLSRRIYEARMDLVQELELRKIVIAGRIPGYVEHAERMKPREYVRKVVAKELTDPVLTAQLANGFVIRTVLRKYLPLDAESGGNAVLMELLNPLYVPKEGPELADKCRVATVQYQMRSISSFEDFATQCEFFVETASEYRVDLLLFPELLTNQLLGLLPPGRPGASARALHQFTPQYMELFTKMALKYNVNIVGGTHLTVEDDTLYNIAYLFHRDGRIDKQYKIHITPSEAKWWGVSGGDSVDVFRTDCGNVAIAICYDVEFPELPRLAKQKGAEILLVPYNTDIRSGHIRVRTCAHARCMENHMYAVLGGATGNLPLVEGADIHWAQSCILTPSDIPFDRDGIASEATPNVEAMVVHELDLEKLRSTERSGTVRPWIDRRTDLYETSWADKQGGWTPKG